MNKEAPQQPSVAKISGQPVSRFRIEAYEGRLIKVIQEITGVEAHLEQEVSMKGIEPIWKIRPVFVGEEHDARIAAHAWNVIYSELRSTIDRMTEKQPGVAGSVISDYAMKWISSVALRFKETLDPVPKSDRVASVAAEITEGMSSMSAFRVGMAQRERAPQEPLA